MDAGVAAVLGAAVGAIGTGGAGAIAALSSRSQARLQLRAEHTRMVREPRKSTYVAYAEMSKKAYDYITAAERKIKIMSQVSIAAADELIEQAREAYDTATEVIDLLQHAEAKVYVEGPPTVRSSAIRFSGALTDFRSAVLDALNNLPDESITVDDIEAIDLEAVRDKRGVAYRAYLEFLYKASDAIGTDGLIALRE